MGRVSFFCFFASYAVALGLELWHQFRPRPVFRLLGLAFAAAGLLAQTIFLVFHHQPLAQQFGWLVCVAWILAIYYISGSLHYRQLAWGVFVLPLILALLVLGLILGGPSTGEDRFFTADNTPISRVWGPVHAVLLLLASIGVCIAFLASLMYLYHSGQLRSRTPPGKGLRLLSLERLEEMNRRAITLAFPLLTAGMLVGLILLPTSDFGWTDPRIISTAILWLVFAVLLYLRFGRSLRGRNAAFLTIVAFALLLCCLALSHSWKPTEPSW
jgi:ABC-type transport system involved in cytochrome c biogenesis permease subunit